MASIKYSRPLEFKEAAGKIHSQTISAWQSRSVQKAVKSVEGAFITSSEENLPAEDLSPSDRPSSVLLEALIALISDTHRLGLSRPTLDSRRIFSTSLDGFTVGCLDLVKIDSLRPNTFTSQLLWDALFLEALCQEMEVTGTNKGAIAKLQEQVSSAFCCYFISNFGFQGDLSDGCKVRSKILDVYARVRHSKSTAFPTTVVATYQASYFR